MDHRITSKPEEDNSKSTHDKTHDSHSSYYAVEFPKFLYTNASVCSINAEIALLNVWQGYFTVNMHLVNFLTYPPKE